MLTNGLRTTLSLVLLVLLGFGVSSQALAAMAGRFLVAVGDVRVQTGDAGAERQARRGMTIAEGETVVTGTKARAQLKMIDGGLISLRPDSSLNIQTYRHDPQGGGEEEAVMNLIKGGFRSVTGAIGKINKENYAINTPTGTIGIRGTDHEPFYIPPGWVPPGPHSGAPPEPGTYDRVNRGATILTSGGGQLIIGPGQVGFVPTPNAMPTLLPQLPQFYQQATPQVESGEDRGDRQGGGEGGGDEGSGSGGDEGSGSGGDSGGDSGEGDETGSFAPTAVTPDSGTGENEEGSVTPTTGARSITGTSSTGYQVDFTNEQTEPSIVVQVEQAADDAVAALTSITTLVSDTGTARDSATSTLADLSQVDLSGAIATVDNLRSAYQNADGSVTDTLALSAPDLDGVNTALSAAQTAKQNAADAVDTAAGVIGANGAFADIRASTALSAMNTALTTLQGAFADAQSAADDAQAQATLLGNAQGTATTARGDAQTSLGAADAALSAAQDANTGIAGLIAERNTLLQQAESAWTNAQTLQQTATTLVDDINTLKVQAEDLMLAGDTVGAQQALDDALGKLADVNTLLSTAQGYRDAAQGYAAQVVQLQSAADSAVTAAQNGAQEVDTQAGTATGYLGQVADAVSTAASAKSGGDAAVAAVGTKVQEVNAQLALINQNLVAAAYRNPALVADNMSHATVAVSPDGNGGHDGLVTAGQGQSNTDYVLDGDGNLVQIRNTPYMVVAPDGSSSGQLANADVSFSGGTAADTYGSTLTRLYMGRWSGGDITITNNDSGTSTTRSLGVASAHWLVGQAALPGLVQTRWGTSNYALVANTAPTDTQGNLGTLNSATLSVDFSAQTATAALDVTVGNVTLNSSASGMALSGGLFGANANAAVAPVITCNGGGCAAAYEGSIQGMLTTGAVNAGVSYGIWPQAEASGGFADFVSGALVLSASGDPDTIVTPAEAAATAAQTALTNADNDSSAASSLALRAGGDADAAAQVTPVGLTALDLALGNASTALTTAQGKVSDALAASGADLTQAQQNAGDAQAGADTAAGQAAAAAAAVLGNGSFADTLAVTANSLVQDANDTAQSANQAVQDATAAVQSFNAQFASARNTAQTALADMQTAKDAADSGRSAALGFNTDLANAQTASGDAAAAAEVAAGDAAAAANNAQSAASAADTAVAVVASRLGSADYSGASAAYGDALNAQVDAENAATAAADAKTSASTAADAASAQYDAALTARANAEVALNSATGNAAEVVTLGATVAGSVSDALDAADSAAGAFSDASSSLATLQDKVAVVADNYEIAAYHNPAVATSDRFGHVAFASAVSAGQSTVMSSGSGGSDGQANTTYVLDGSGNLVEIRNSVFDSHAPQPGGAQTTYADVDVSFSGGSGVDAYKSTDNSVYLGRWSGGTIKVADNGGGAVLVDTDLGATSVPWVIALAPSFPYTSTLGPTNVVQTFTGSVAFSQVAASAPVDGYGNVGVLNSAYLNADFSSQLLALGLDISIAQQDISYTAQGVPMDGFSFDASHARSETNTCQGSGCAASSYDGGVSGVFAGDGAEHAVLGYQFSPPSDSSGFADLIQGVVALDAGSSADQLSVMGMQGSTATVRGHLLFPEVSGNYGWLDVASLRDLNPGNVLLDGDGNLVRLLDAEVVSADQGSAVSAVYGSTVSIAGATPGSEGTYSDGNGLTLGRWAGGTVSMSDPATGTSATLDLGAANQSLQWALREVPASIPVSGNYNYVPVYHTRPTDSYGSADGVLNSAALGVDFTRQMVSPSVSVSIRGQDLTAFASDVPLNTAFGFNVSTGDSNPLQVTCSGSNCAYNPYTESDKAFYGGRIRGGLAGDGSAAGAFFSYTFGTGYTQGDPYNPLDTLANDYITGLVAFGRGEELSSISYRNSVLTAYNFDNSAATESRAESYPYQDVQIGYDGAGNVQSIVDSFDGRSVAVTTGTPEPANPQMADHAETTGISFGRWDGNVTLDGVDYAGTGFSSRAVMGSYHWLQAPEPYPFYLPGALTGTADYVYDGGTLPTNQNGDSGVVDYAHLRVDFSRQAISSDLGVTIGDVGWDAQIYNVPLHSDGSFDAYSGDGLTSLSVYAADNVNSAYGSGYGGVNGQLTGLGLNGAGLSYAFNALLSGQRGSSNESVSGVLSFIGPQQNIQTPVNLVLFSLGPIDNLAALSPDYHSVVNGTANSASQLQVNNDNQLEGFNAEVPVDMSTVSPQLSGLRDLPAKIAVGSASVVESGSDAVTGISWGRWAGGSASATYVVDGTSSAPIDLNNQSLHYIMTPEMQGTPVLPTSGTATYTVVGATSPTDNLGNVGTLNEATLAADFNAQTVDAMVKVDINGQNWSAGANNVPIGTGGTFNVDESAGFSVGCSGSGCGSANSGQMGGVFVGDGASGAAMGYSLNTQDANATTPIDTTVSGVVAFGKNP